ncbi:PhoR protein [Paenibacillus sp. A3]|uniref:ATP-binding protein n=1 Tax=Paenibacillus sp. A3 TaxID=1337054 RepID=UPI0006D597A1|nr:ATP-binding protein [Paenibacillus sp. A3]KPV55933.1 PhoR protein [Paenibacillus sp. A3]
MNMTRSKISLGYVIVVISLLVMISVSSFVASSSTEKELNSVVNEVIPLNNLAESLLVDLVNMESGLRGYEVTQDEKYLEPYDFGKAQLQDDLLAMAAFQKKYPGLRSVMEGDAIPQIQRLQEHYASQIELIRAGKLPDAIKRVSMGKNQMDRFRQIHTKLTSEIELIAAEAYSSAQTAEKRARVIVFIGGGIAIIVGLFSFFIFNRANQAEAKLRKSEETYRHMAESLEVQNEEIIAQQEEQEATLEKLSQRELELEAISSYQEKLTGSTDMADFLNASLPALLESLNLDAALLVLKTPGGDGAEASYQVAYSIGYPSTLPTMLESELFGMARRVLKEKMPLESVRQATAQEGGFHQGITHAIDRYYPLFNDEHETTGFLLLTGYLTSPDEQKTRLAKGLIRQFGLAFLAQQMNEERRRQSARLEALYEQLQQEKAAMEEQRDLINNILESTHEGMMMCDASGKLMFFNHRMNDFLRLSGRTGESIAEISRELLDRSPSFARVSQSIRGLLRGDLNTLTERFSFTDGEEQQRYVELYAIRMMVERHDEELGFLFVFRDRTEEEKVDEMKNEFISIVSHELRTPLASVLGFIEILLNRQLTPEKQQRYLQTVYKEATRLSTLINDFLDLQRMESGKQIYHFAPVELGGLLQEVVEQWRGKQSHDISLHLPQQEVWVRGDADRLKQVAHNLLSNAIKYSPQAERVDLTLRQDGQDVQFLVQDYGLGIPEEAKDKLFSKFYRVDNSDRRQIGGTGLGLSIVREIVEGHEGTVAFESEMGAGTTFTVTLQAYRVGTADNSIMILEDDDNLAKLIQVALAKLHIPTMHVRSAEEGILALHRIEEGGPRLCIVDIHLEGTKNGWDFIGELYRHPKFYRTPVIVSTALEPPQDYHEKDIEKFLRKPFSMDKLLQVAEQLLSNTDRHPAYIFPAQDENFLTNTLAKNGIEVEEITRKPDLIEIEPKTRRPSGDEGSRAG